MNTYNYIDPITNQIVTIRSKREYTHIVLVYGQTAAERADGIDYSNTIVDESLCSSFALAQKRVEGPKDHIIALKQIA
jgi:hypothetical protein